MFSVSNKIAYDSQMVHAVDPGTVGPIGLALGPSAWMNVDGRAESKWCPDEGEVVVRLLYRLAEAGVRDPDVYVIAPFRMVANELRRRLEREEKLFQRLGVELNTWVLQRVGTIHTFQGKEAEAVVAVLGAPMNAQQSARRWASATPNILNVMVSRAKLRLYVVGSRAAWGELGHARTLARALPNSA